MKALATSTLALGLLLTTTACGAREGSAEVAAAAPSATRTADLADPEPSVTGADWDAWTGVYGTVRPASEELIAELRARVDARNQTSWTAVEAGSGAVIAYTPDHVRVSWGYVDLHLDAEALHDLVAPFTVCDEAACHDVDPEVDGSEDDVPALPPTAGAAYASVQAQQVSEEDLADVLNEGIVSVARVESPVGPLDCLVHAESKKEVEHLPGADLVVGSGSMHEPWASLCVDQRGLVVLGLGEPGIAVFESWQPGVDDDVTSLVPAAGLGDPDPVDPTGDYERAAWSTWEGVYEDVRPATEAYVAAVRERVLARNTTSWTGVVDELGMTLSVTPDHVRADFGGGVEVHLDPYREPYVVCAQDECVRIGPDAEPEGPHVTNDFLDGMTFYVQAMVYWQLHDRAIRLQPPMVAATVETPVGPLDCLVRGRAARELETLEGASAVPIPTRRSWTGRWWRHCASTNAAWWPARRT